MATPRKDWEKEWKAVQKQSRTLAKRANQRMVRLERYSQRQGLSEILKFAYQKAQQYISTNLGGKRYKEHVKLYDVSDGSKQLKGQDLYRANVMIQRQRIKAMEEFLAADTSTLGQSRSGVKTKGIAAIFDKRTETINEKFLKKYGLSMTDSDLKRFFDSKKQAKLEKLVSSSLMFVVASVIKKNNLRSNKRDLERFIKSHVDLEQLQEQGMTKEDLNAKPGESYQAYLSRLQDFVKYTGDEALDEMVSKALKNGINATNIFI